MTRDELIRALEAAEGPSRELDAAIHCAARGWTFCGVYDCREANSTIRHWYASYAIPGRSVGPYSSRLDSEGNWPPYTASLDAALSLVPEGRAITGAFSATHGVRSFFTVARAATYEHPSRGETPALALCAAALRAQEETP